jgi:hypothetical protein
MLFFFTDILYIVLLVGLELGVWHGQDRGYEVIIDVPTPRLAATAGTRRNPPHAPTTAENVSGGS